MRFVARRLGFYLVAAWAAITINFFIPRLMPGNPVAALLGKYQGLPPDSARTLEIEFGIGHQGTILHQYWSYLGNLFQGNLGVSSSQYPEKVTTVIGQVLPWTLALVGTATLIAFLLGTLLGIFAGWRRGGWLDQSLPVATFMQATPYFFVGLAAIEVLSVKLGVFPYGGGSAIGLAPGFNWTFLSSAFVHSVLPATTIIITSFAGWMLTMRNVMITTIGEDYVLVAQAKGLPRRRIIFSYAARNAILPNIAGFSLAIGYVVAGALLTEYVFSYPGIGLMLYNAVTSDDYPLTQGIFLVISLAILLACLLADMVYVLADPRARARSSA